MPAPTPSANPFTSYDMTAGIPVNMDTAIYMYDPDDSPLLTGRNAQGGLVMPVIPIDAVKAEWMDEDRLTPESRAGATIAATTTATVLTVQSGEHLHFSTGDVVAVEGTDEHIRITGYGTTDGTLLVTRAWGGTTVGAVTSGNLVVGVGTVLTEGSNPENARQQVRVERYNLTQIFGPTKIDMSRTEQRRAKYGVANEFAHQVDQRIIENIIARERAHVYGKRYEHTTNEQRQMGGFKYWITTNVDSTSTTMGVTEINTQLQKCYNNGGVPDVLLANPASLADINQLSDTGRVRVEIEDPIRGRMPVEVIMTEFGAVTVKRDRWVFPIDAFLYRTGQAVRRVFDPLLFERLAKTGDSDEAQIVCEETQQFKGERHAARFSNLTGYSYNW